MADTLRYTMGSNGPQDNYVLSWNDFGANVVSSLQDIREQEDFYDVSLACDEDHVIQSHKVILSASSPYFRGILKRSPPQNPVIIMPAGVRFRELAQLIDFIYNGTVQVAQDEIQAFLALAEQFKIKGLTEDKGKLMGAKPMLPNSKPQPPKAPPKLPAGIQMVRRPAGPPPPQTTPKGVKRPLLSEPDNSTGSYKSFVDSDGVRVHDDPDDNDMDDDEVIDDDMAEAGGEFYDEFEDSGDFGEYDYDENGTPISQQSGSHPSSSGSGLQLTGLLCPTCRVVCHGVDALKDHISKMHGMAPQGHQSPRGQQGQFRIAAHTGAPTVCDICDKTFKDYRYMVAHKKRIHYIIVKKKDGSLPGISPAGKRIGRPTKKSMLEMEEGSSEGPIFEQELATAQPVAKQGMIQPSVSRPAVKKESKPLPENVGMSPAGMSPAVQQRQPNAGPRGAPPISHEQYLMSESQGSSKRLPPPTRLPPVTLNPASRPGSNAPNVIDIKSLGHKLGGQISIVSSEAGSSQDRRGPPSHGVGPPPMDSPSKSVARGVMNRRPIVPQHKPLPVEELEVYDEVDLDDEDYDDAQYGDEDDSNDYDPDGEGQDMSDSVERIYDESQYEQIESDDH